jgi:hypothetical protein
VATRKGGPVLHVCWAWDCLPGWVLGFDAACCPARPARRACLLQGVRGLFKGWGAQWARQGPMTTVIFVVSESLRQAMGMESI